MMDKILNYLFTFYDPNEKIGFYRSFEYWFDNIPFIDRNFLSLVSVWLMIIGTIQISCVCFLVYFF